MAMSSADRLSSTLRDARGTIRDKAHQVGEKANDLAEDVSERASKYYEDAQDWLRENQGLAIGATLGLVAMGLIGFFIGRSSLDD